MGSRVVPARSRLGLAGGNRQKGVLLAIVGMVSAMAIGMVPATPAQAADSKVQQTQYGPLTAADRDMLVKVRLAGLWEGPAGRESLRRSQNPKVREAGQHLIDGHQDLDNRVLEISNELGVTLPVEPTGELISRLNQMNRARTNEEFDQRFVDLLRAAHGGVYQLLAKMRAGTRNSLIRQFADQCMATVLDHITVLEATGMVNWNLLPLPPAPGADQQPQTGMVATQQGPLTLADRDFLVKVRQAGLWEGPSGEQSQERSENQAIKDAGQHLIDGHAELDNTALEVAGQLNVQLPTEPNADQQAWMAEMAAAPTPAAYDQVFVKRLRAAHGKVFGLVAQVRAGTRNELIRSFATRTMEVVLDHIAMLENTALVNFNALPPPPEPTSSIPVRGISVNPLMVIAALVVAAAMTYAARGRIYRA